MLTNRVLRLARKPSLAAKLVNMSRISVAAGIPKMMLYLSVAFFY